MPSTSIKPPARRRATYRCIATNSSDRTPLLPNGRDHSSGPVTFGERVRALVIPEHGPTWGHSMHYFFFSSWFNVFLVFVPLSFVAHNLDWDAGLRFLFSFLAILPLAKARVSLLGITQLTNLYALAVR